MILSRSRSPKRRHQDKIASSLLFFFGRGRMRARAGGERRVREKRGMTGIFFALYWCSLLVFLLSSVLFHNSDGVTGPFFLKHCTLLPTTLEMGKINNWTYFYGKCPAENAGNGISDTLIFWGNMLPEPPRLGHLRRYNFSSPRTYTLKISRYVHPEQFL